jgi:hypothetical protein
VLIITFFFLLESDPLLLSSWPLSYAGHDW